MVFWQAKQGIIASLWWSGSVQNPSDDVDSDEPQGSPFQFHYGTLTGRLMGTSGDTRDDLKDPGYSTVKQST
jgi:hypothetical protein